MRTSLDQSSCSSRLTCWPIPFARLTAVLVLVAALAPLGRAEDASWDGVWRTVAQVPAKHVGGEPWVRPNRFQGALLDNASLAQRLSQAPLEDTREAETNPLYMTLPTPDGVFALFRVVESPIMEPGLAAQFPQIKTYLGQGVDDPTATVRLDTTPLGFHAQVLSPNGNYYIDPYTKNDNDFYASYYKRDLTDRHGFSCHPAGDEAVHPALPAGEGGDKSSGGTRRTYRLANACTGEYAAYFGGTVALAQSAIVTAINRVTGVYETECAIRLTLVANNTSIVYTNSSTDPYTNNNGVTMLSQNISTCNSVIGSANYDIGHVFSTGGGGVAYLGVVCTSNKAGGVTGSSSPVGDAYYIDYVAHEMGHQFGANHNFNGTGGSCGGGNRNASTAYEPGSGSTIMSYAGICSADNLQAHSDAYFSADSYREILAYVTSGSGASCASTTSTGNNPPTVNAGADYTIPKQTPFQLTATGSDPDGDALTYFWEERDLGAAQSASGGIIADNGTSPFIRPWTPTTDPSRIVPRLSNLLANTLAFGEQLPNTNRTVKFRCTARDNRAGNGGVNYDDMIITVTTAAGPLLVTSPNTAVSWSGTQTVTWNVASTTAAPVSCANVRILLSTDGGNTWPTVLLASTPNDGSQSVTLPSISTTTARIRVEAVGNIFFDISNVNFTITPGGTAPSITGQPSNQTVCSGGSASFTVTATGSPAPTYQWRKGTTNLSNGGSISGATTATLTINPVGTGDAATNYNCVATNASGSATSNDASLTVNVAPSITGQPSNQTVCSGGSASFTVTATGTPAPTYQWREGTTNLTNGGNISGTTTATLTINPAGTGDAASNYNCVATNSCGSATSNNASLTVNPLPDCTITPAPPQVCANSPDNTASVPNAGVGATYAWTITNGTITAGAGTNQITYTAGATGPVHLTVTVTTAAGCMCNNATDVPVVTCGATGACCSTNGTCAVVTSADCATAGGVYSGDGTVCRPGNLCPASCKGDMNCDGRVTFADIDLFVAALSGESFWTGWPCPWLNADANNDLAVTFADIDPFVALIGTTCP